MNSLNRNSRAHLTLKVTLRRLVLTRERRLRLLWLYRIKDLPIRDITHLEVQLLHQALLIAHSVLPLRHERITRIIRLADIAIYATPTLITITRLFIRLAQRPVLKLPRQRSTQRLFTVFTAKAGRTYALAVCLVALSKLVALEVFEIAVEARRTTFRSICEEVDFSCVESWVWR